MAAFDDVKLMLTAYDRLQMACDQLSEALRKDKELPFELMGFAKPYDRESAISALVRLKQLDTNESIPYAGIMCVSPQNLAAVAAVNSAKDQFFESVQTIREQASVKRTRIEKLVANVLPIETERTESLDIALRCNSLGKLDLTRAFAQIRVLPARTESISFTWAMSHTAIKTVEHKDVMTMAKHLDEGTQELVAQLVARLQPGEVLVQVRDIAPNLRANLVYDTPDGYKRKAVTISGICISQESKLPARRLWRDRPQKQEQRLNRLDSTIEPVPYISILRLHLYKK